MLMVQQAVDDGLTLTDILSDIPHDAGAVIVYILVLAFAGFVWYGSRHSSAAATREADDDEQR